MKSKTMATIALALGMVLTGCEALEPTDSDTIEYDGTIEYEYDGTMPELGDGGIERKKTRSGGTKVK